MKKYLMTGVAALALCATFTSCSHDIDSMSQEELTDYYVQKIVQTYEKAFIENIGQPAPDQDWGFGATTSGIRTRTITVNGDAYDKFPSAADVAANFPTTIPTADEVSQLEALYKGQTIQTQQYGEQTLHDIYAIYAYKIVEGYNLKITSAGNYPENIVELGGNYQNASWLAVEGHPNGGYNYAHPYNVYVDVEGSLTIRRVGATHFNLYILRGNVTLESNYGEQAGIISVASGATLNDQRNSIAANQGIKLFNRGTVNATNTEKYDIGNFSTVYNEGKFNVSGPLTYSPGDANDSYFMNLGDDAELTAPAMTLNSTGNFFNDGKVTITGETKVTQARLYWVNAGHYTTGSMTFSAKNTTFYNYCQLIVTGNAHMYDGEFNLMANSYTEAGTGEFDNFIVNMASNTGMYIKGNVRMIAQGDGTYQGFRTSGSNDYVLIGGKVTVDAHYHTFSISSGITYSINQIEIVRDGNVITEEYLQSVNDGAYPVLDLNGTECPYGKLTVTRSTTSCGATWNQDGDDDEEEEEDDGGAIRVIAEDLTATTGNDFDFNDVVFDVTYGEANEAKITVRAAGGTLPLRIKVGAGNTEADYQEVHALWEQSTGIMINTDYDKKYTSRSVINLPAKDVTLGYAVKTPTDVRDLIKIEVQKTVNGQLAWIELKSEQGKPAAKIAVNLDWHWLNERVDITTIDGFVQYVTNRSTWVGSLPSK
jgi:hypothetical protein